MNTSTSIHNEAELWAAAASTGGLTELELKAWNEHIAACPACHQLNEEEHTMARLIKNTLDAGSPDPGFEQRMLRKFNQAHPGNGNRWYEHLLFHPGLTLAAACVALVAIAGIGSLVRGGKQPAVASAPPTGLDALPPALRDAILHQSGGNAVASIQRDEEDGEVVYNVGTKTQDGHETDFTVAGDGTLLSIDTTLAEVPQNVRNAINTQAGKGVLKGIGKTFDQGETSYVATIAAPDGNLRNFTFAQDGALLEVEAGLAELPAPLQAAINAQAAQGKLKGIDKTFDNGETNYVATIAAPDGSVHDFTFAADGTLLEVETSLAELPAPVQAAITARMGQAAQGTLEGIAKTFDNGETNYVATVASVNGSERDFTFGADGTLASVEVTQDEVPAAVQAAIHAQVGRGKLDGIDKTFDSDGITYDGSMINPDGSRREFTLSEQGKLLSREVTVKETPGAVQQTISRTLGTGKVVEINQSFTDLNIVPYEIEGQKDGKPLYFVVSPTGNLLSMEN